jgi:hypothetical protein
MLNKPEFLARFARLSPQDQRAALDILYKAMARLGVDVEECVQEAKQDVEQARIDIIAASLLEDVEVSL